MLAIEIATIAALILLNSLLALSELAVVSSRPARLKARQQAGARGAGRALALTQNPGRFLSSVQIGITLVGVLSGAISGSTLGIRLSAVLTDAGVAPGLADTLGVGGVVAIITYFSLVVGELVPKQIALRNPEGIAIKVAPLMTVLAMVAAPLVWLLDISGRLILSLLGQTGAGGNKVTDEEIRTMIAEAEHQGTIETDERRMIAGVMRLSDRAVRAIMTPRNEVEWLDLDANKPMLRKFLAETQHSRLPAAEGSIDQMVGVVHTRELLSALLKRKAFNPRDFVHKVPVVHDNADALDVLALLRKAEVPMALVHDEYGAFEGLVTPADVLETIAGAFKSDLGNEEPPIVQRADDSWLLAGDLSADDMADTLGFSLPARREYETVAGFLLSHLHYLPKSGETVDAMGWRFEVVDLDGRRIDKVIASKLPATHREKQNI